MGSMRFRRLAAALGFVSLPAAITLPGWETSGPSGTRVNAVSAAPDDDSRAYAAATILESATSALYRTDDGGLSWTGLAEAGPGDSFGEIFADPRDGQRVFASAQRATGATEIYRSTDRGEIWATILSLSTRCVPSFAAGTAPDSLFLACGARFLRSNDAGISWDEPANPFTENVRLTRGPSGLLYAYGLSRVFRSSDAGTTWTPAALAPPACPGILSFRVDPTDPDVFVAGTGVLGTGGFQCGGVHRSANGGTSWEAPGLTGVYVTDVALDPAQPSRVFASASYIAGILPPGGVFVSGNGGRSFSNARLPVTGALELALSATGRYVYAATALGVYQDGMRRTRVVTDR
jgi:hypothetical protein